MTITIPGSIKHLLVKELKKFIEAIQMEFELTGELYILENIEDSKSLILRLLLANAKVEVTLSEFLIMATSSTIESRVIY